MKFREFIPIAIILFVAAVVRLIFLDRIPGGIGGDELNYILAAKYVAVTGSDILGHWNIFSALIFNYPSGFPQAELPYFLILPFVYFPFSLLTVRLIYAVLSIATVIALYLLAKELFNKNIGLIAAALCAINPWQIFIGRTTYEMVPATFFYCLAIYLLIVARARQILFTIPIFAVAFYSYIGLKVASLQSGKMNLVQRLREKYIPFDKSSLTSWIFLMAYTLFNHYLMLHILKSA